MNSCFILVLRAVGRLSDVRRGEDEHSWARPYYAVVLIHSCPIHVPRLDGTATSPTDN
jgi:hypothetical protein